MHTMSSYLVSQAPMLGMLSPNSLLILVVAASPFIATLLGWIAVAQIRRSGGKMYGLGLAVFDGLLFPLLLLDAVLFVVYAAIIRALRGLPLELSDAAGIALVIGLGVFALALIAWLDFWIVRAVWRAVNKGLAPAVPSLGKTDAAPFPLDSARGRQALETPAAQVDPLLWSPGQSQLVRDICAHMTEAEKRDATRRGMLFGLWSAGTFFIPFFLIMFSSLPGLMSWIYGGAALVIGLAFYPLLLKMQKEFLASTAWARQQHIRPEQIRRFGRRRAVADEAGPRTGGWWRVPVSVLWQLAAALPLLFFSMFIVPKFGELAHNAGVTLPSLSAWVVRVSDFVNWHNSIELALLLATILISWALWRSGGARRLRRWTASVAAVLVTLFVVAVAAVLVPILCVAPQLLAARPAPSAISYTVFEVAPQLADQIVPPAQRQNEFSDTWQLANISPATLRALLAGRVTNGAVFFQRHLELRDAGARTPTYVNAQKKPQEVVVGWPLKVDSWVHTGPAYQVSGTGWCGLRRSGEQLEARIEQTLTCRVGGRPPVEVHLSHTGPASETQPWIFFVPYARLDNTPGCFAIALEPARGTRAAPEEPAHPPAP